MPRHESTASLEQEIVRMKSDLVQMSRNRNLAFRNGRHDEGRRQHLFALEAELKHVSTLARYVQTVSPGAGRELATWQTIAEKHFQDVKTSRDIQEVNRWVTRELAPLLNKSEQAAHIVASVSRREDGLPARPFAWRPKENR